ncbi:hypothetical protein F5Y16DRAFT_390229 [Xylariaceae sp. FL0255]|nr:hypothetical protein F5Y16DRAFT_390229 [Xylariaceae sp. FL0255]
MRATLSRLAVLTSPAARKPRPPTHHPPPETVQQDYNRPNTNRHVVASCRRHNIAFSQHLTKAKGVKLHAQNPFQLVIKCSRRHCLSLRHERYFDRDPHPLARYMLDFYIDKKNTPLWMHIHAHSGSAYANRHAERKTKAALREAMAELGYQLDGQRLAKDILRNPHDQKLIVEMWGSLQVGIVNSTVIAGAKFADLVDASKLVVQAVVNKLGRGRDGKFVAEWEPQTNFRRQPRPHQPLPKPKVTVMPTRRP